MGSTTYENCGLVHSEIIDLFDMKLEVNCDLGGYPIEVGMTLSPPIADGSWKAKDQYK